MQIGKRLNSNFSDKARTSLTQGTEELLHMISITSAHHSMLLLGNYLFAGFPMVSTFRK